MKGGTGQYRLADLPAGTYSMTFALRGFATLKREGLELREAFIATVHAVLRPGTVARTLDRARPRS